MVEKCKNLQNKACLIIFSPLANLMCSGTLGGDFLTFSLWDSVHGEKIKITFKVPHIKTQQREGKQALFCKFLLFSCYHNWHLYCL